MLREGDYMSDGHNKRMACQIAAQLPDETSEALEVLAYVREIVLNLGGGWGLPVRTTPTPLYAVPRTGPAASASAETAVQPYRPDRASPE